MFPLETNMSNYNQAWQNYYSKKGKTFKNDAKANTKKENAKPPVKHEHHFERDLEFFCSINGVAYIKIPDWIATRERIETLKLTGKSNEKQKPFDGVLVTPNAVYCVECKYGSNTLSEHQKHYRDLVDSRNPGSFLVLRKKSDTDYVLEVLNTKKVFTDIVELIKYIKHKQPKLIPDMEETDAK